MDYLKLLSSRRSCRAFTAEPVSEEDIRKLLLAANGAPVGSNLYKDLHLTVVRDRVILHELARAAVERRRDKATMDKIVSSIEGSTEARKEPDPFYGAGTVIFVSHRKQDLQPGIEYANAACLTLSMHLEAAQLGLGSVFIWGVLEAMRVLPEFDRTALLGLPAGFEPLLGLAVGYPAKPLPARELRCDKLGTDFLNGGETP